MSNKRDKTPGQEKFKPSGKLTQQQHNLEKEFQNIVEGFEQLGEPIDETIIAQSKQIEQSNRSQSASTRSQSGEKKRFKVNPLQRRQVDIEVIKKEQLEQQNALNMDEEADLDPSQLRNKKGQTYIKIIHQKIIFAYDNLRNDGIYLDLSISVSNTRWFISKTVFDLEKEANRVIKKKSRVGFKVSSEECKIITRMIHFVTCRMNKSGSYFEFEEQQCRDQQTRVAHSFIQFRFTLKLAEGTYEEEEEEQAHSIKPENMFEPAKLPFSQEEEGNLSAGAASQGGSIAKDILDPSRLNMLQFPTQFLYKLGPNAKTKLRLKKFDENKLHENREILNFNVQKPYDSAGNPIKYSYNTIDHFAVKDPKKEQSFLMGKLRIYKDGSTQFVCGQNIFDVTEGIQNQCKQQFIAIDANMQLAEHPSVFNLDSVNKKFVIQPNIDELYKK